jgi:DNA-binding CsgD family transcriptional regulator
MADNRYEKEESFPVDGLLAQFAETFGQAAAALLTSRHWVTYIVGPELKIRHFLVGNTEPGEQEVYANRFFALDPLAPHHCLATGCHVASLRAVLQSNNPNHEEYRRLFLAPYAIVDALEIFLRSDAGLVLGCSLLRHGQEVPFSVTESQQAVALKSLGDFALSRTFPQRQASLEVIAERFPLLTPRETMLVQLVAAGLSNKQLGKELNISLPTVKTHLLSIYRKLGVASRTELAMKVLG